MREPWKIINFKSTSNNTTATSTLNPFSEWLLFARYYSWHIVFYLILALNILGLPDGSDGKNPPAMQNTWVWFLCWADPLEKGMTTHSSILAWNIPWTEEPGGLQSMGWQRVRQDWATIIFTWWLQTRNIYYLMVSVRKSAIWEWLNWRFLAWGFLIRSQSRCWLGLHLSEDLPGARKSTSRMASSLSWL